MKLVTAEMTLSFVVPTPLAFPTKYASKLALPLPINPSSGCAVSRGSPATNCDCHSGRYCGTASHRKLHRRVALAARGQASAVRGVPEGLLRRQQQEGGGAEGEAREEDVLDLHRIGLLA